MKGIVLVLFTLMCFGCAVYPISTFGWKHQAKTDPPIDAKQTAFYVDLKKGVAVVSGYYPISKKNISSDYINQMVEDDQLCKSVYDFEALEYLGEQIVLKDDSIPVFECHLRFTSPDTGFVLADFFAHLFRKNVSINGGEEEIGVIYYWNPIEFGPGNDLGHPSFQDKNGKMMNSIWWKKKEGLLKGVLTGTVKGYERTIKWKKSSLPIESPNLKRLKMVSNPAS